jgi:hypothetical protein
MEFQGYLNKIIPKNRAGIPVLRARNGGLES